MNKGGKILIIVLIILAVGAATLGIILYQMFRTIDLSDYQHLVNPEINDYPDQRMLVVELTGDPNAISGEAISELFQIYYKLPADQRATGNQAPRARWTNIDNEDMNNLNGLYGLPVSSSLESPPANAPDNVSVQTWEYGDTAEILHIGPYSEEDPTIAKLKQYITEQGYKIIGDHEEVYLKGPGMFWRGDSNKYQTLIRYRVTKEQPVND